MLYNRTLFIHSAHNSLLLLTPNSHSISPHTCKVPCTLTTTGLFSFCFVDKFMCHILDSTYKYIYGICLPLSDLLSDNLQVHPCCCKWHFYSFLWLSNIPLYIYIYIYMPYFFYQFMCQWTFRLHPCLNCYKWCCYEHSTFYYILIILFSSYIILSLILTFLINSLKKP